MARARPALLAVHVTQGRARLRPAAAMDAAALHRLGERIAALPEVARVLSRPRTGSLIVEFAGPPEPVLAAIAERVAPLRDPDPPLPVGELARAGLVRADLSLRGTTGGALDLDAALALVLTGAAVLQASRGRVAGPASSLLLSALTLLRSRRS